ncbi:hypothetical protein [Deinococcus cellulosilyticus]|uniref:Uncharacterized protein n=1 Tax=Deinococcus cellulosilyticus (strain DSM 18568 / NBRC 106333 / KACC 11606 / 5516J-15) TaxID=1223518 RepID=A0A511MWN0_DEIC1|nr:hypothetical protein [Deinococcus cellulosilyticus]GEM44526.1 hypothetical protein DC3_01610 [Deinococcus cellulosilyticus NBRC 106333 = KACC 11606]
MLDVRGARKRLKTAKELLHDPTPEHHQEVREDLLNAYQTLTTLAHDVVDLPSKPLLLQDFRLNHNWSRDLIEDALLCLDDVKTHRTQREKLLMTAAEYVREAYLLI